MSIQDLASKGRFGDDAVMHVSNAEVQGLDNLARSIYGHELPTNPETGLKEAFLFAPLLAPLIAGGGASALGIGMTAGALGAAEASARGMDNPLAQGLMAGLTAGAGSAITSNLANTGFEAAMSPESLAQVGGGMDAAGSALTNTATQAGTNLGTQAQQSALQNAAGQYGTSVASPQTATLASQDALMAGPSYAQTTPNAPSFMGRNAPNLGNVQSGASAFGPSRLSDIGRGAEQAFGSQAGFKNFMAQNQGALGLGAAGLGGSAALDAAEQMKKDAAQREADKKAEQQGSWNRIRDIYSAAGRPMTEGMKKYGGFAGGGYVEGGIASLQGDGMSDSVPAMIDNQQPAALSSGEYVIPADVVSHLGNGSSDGGAMRLDEMLNRVRDARTGNQSQAPQINPNKYMPS